MMTLLLQEDFSGFDVGMFSADVGPHTEYHFLQAAAPRHGWSVACFATGPGAGTAWWVATETETETETGRHVMRQTHSNEKSHTHPILTAGDELWGDYVLRVAMRPETRLGRCGVIVRYHNSRCYTFFGFEGPSLVLLQVAHESAFHTPSETVLAATPCIWEPGADYTLEVSVQGNRIEASIDNLGTLSALNDSYRRGKIGLLSDGPAVYASVEVTAQSQAVEHFHIARSQRQRELDDLRASYPKPVVCRRLSTSSFGVGRNVRFGDIDGDGELEIVLGQMNAHGPGDAYSEVGCITAMDLRGEVLWQSGEPDPDRYQLTNDVAFQVHDIDGDGLAEVIYTRDFELVIADGRTGAVRNRVPTPVARKPADKFARILGDCLFFCDLRGTGRAADIVIKDRYWHFWVYDDQLQLQWQGDCNTGHYPFAYDIDGDGHDELAIGYSMYDHDGSLLWSLQDQLEEHADGIAIVDWMEQPGSKPRILYAASDDGLVLADLEGNILRHHRIGHAQNPVIGKFRHDLPGLQAVSINFWGNQGILHFYDGDGNIYHDAEPVNLGSMCLPINWTGEGTELFVHSANSTHGGMFDGWGRPVVMFPDDGHPDLCNAVVDLTGDCRDEVIVWDQHEMWVYTQDDGPKTGPLYCPVRNSLSNDSNYRATVSLPGWTER
jgi:rhamnogalacturonan endolyase